MCQNSLVQRPKSHFAEIPVSKNRNHLQACTDDAQIKIGETHDCNYDLTRAMLPFYILEQLVVACLFWQKQCSFYKKCKSIFLRILFFLSVNRLMDQISAQITKSNIFDSTRVLILIFFAVAL